MRTCNERIHSLPWKLAGCLRILAIIALGIHCAVLAVAAEAPEPSRHIVLLHTNDQHLKFNHLGAMQAGVARFRRQYTDVFLLDAGDVTIRPVRWSQNRIVNNAGEYAQHLETMISAMNALGYDAFVLGNHELGYHTTITRDLLRAAEFPILGANIRVSTTQFEQPRPYVILDAADGIRLAVLGLSGGTFENEGGVVLLDAFQTVSEYKDLRDTCSVFILLTHVGVKDDRRLADQYGGLVDVIIGGHSHTRIDPPESRNNVLIAQVNPAYTDSQYLGVIRLTLDPDGRLVGKEGEVLEFPQEGMSQSRFLSAVDE